jgi:hypothetical protein
MEAMCRALAASARKQAEVVQEPVGDTDVLERVFEDAGQIFGCP